MNDQLPTLITHAAVCVFFNRKRDAIWRMRKTDKNFPKPVLKSPLLWVQSDIVNYAKGLSNG